MDDDARLAAVVAVAAAVPDEASSEPASAKEESDPDLIRGVEEAQRDEVSRIEMLRRQQEVMERENNKRKDALARAIADRTQKTSEEVEKLRSAQLELTRIDVSLSSDVRILRDSIEEASLRYTEARKRYDRAEKEFVSSKLSLHAAAERKDLLTEHLCAIIAQTELRKAEKLTKLMQELNIPEQA